MAEFAEMKTLDVWYAHLSEADLMASVQAAVTDLSGTGKDLKVPEEAGEARHGGGPEGARARQRAGPRQARRSWSTAATGS